MKKRNVFLIFIVIVVIFSIYKIQDTMKLNETSNITMNSKKDGKNLTILIIKGKEYLHKFQVNSFISIKTPPQYAVWIEDLNGNYVETLYVTSKIVKQNWSEIKRKEALPYWNYKRSNNSIDTDAVSSATPKSSSSIKTKTNEKQGKYVICAEVNMSTDFNEYYKKDAVIGKDNYSGGASGSGQPSIIYTAVVDLSLKNGVYELKPIGHSSYYGSDAKLYKDMYKLTTAKNILKSIIIDVN